MARTPASLPQTLGASFTTREALAAGVSLGQLRRQRLELLERPVRGVYLQTMQTGHRADMWRTRQLLAARSLATEMPDHHFFNLHTAAVLWGLPAPIRPDSGIAVSCVAPMTPTRRSGTVSSQVQPAMVSIEQLNGMRVASAPSLWAMYAPKLSIEDAVALGDSIVREHRIAGTNRLERPPLATIDELRRAAGVRRRRGRAKLLQALALTTTKSASVPESHLRLQLMKWRITPTALDHDVYDSAGRFLGCSEIAYPELKVAVEYEGAHHLHEVKQWNRDIEKYADYTAAGWRVVRVTANLLYRQSAKLHLQLTETLRLAAGGQYSNP